jgi:lipoprotein-releasing system ATP-binding protein
MNNAVLSVRGLGKTFESGGERLDILRGLDLRVEEGERAVIVGESGSGKSTLLHLVAGLDAPTAGTIEAGGLRIDALREKELASYRARYVALIFQFHYLLQDFSALENVFLPAYMAGVPKKAALERARSLLADVGLERRLEHLPSQLSGGERQRTAVARALVNEPRLILADEPTGSLDRANADMIADLLFSITGRCRTALLLVTHDFGVARRGDSRYRLSGGRLAAV